MKYHTIIVGAGSAGCVLTARLSENPNHSVLLLEAGPDYPPPVNLPPEIRNGFKPAFTHDWGYSSEPGLLGRSFSLPRGKLVGGCSATNAAIALRGAPSDYDEWSARGNPGWSFSEVLPFFCRIENDADFDDHWHGRNGPLPIHRDVLETLLPEHSSFLQACSILGYPRIKDHNAPGAIGAGVIPRNEVAGIRQSAALTYLSPARDRTNCTIRSNVLIDRVIFDGQRAIGVSLNGSTEIIQADRVILSAGSFGSPAILMRSGIGPADHLRSLDIKVVRDIPGVGQNLCDHVLLELQFTTLTGSNDVPGYQAMLTLKSPNFSVGPDLQIFPWTIYQAEHGESPIFEILVALVKPLSHGSLRLRSGDPNASPLIDMGYFMDPGDMPRVIHAMRIARRLSKTPPLSDIALREIFPGPHTTDADVDLEAAAWTNAGTYHHPVGTCRMGPATDTSAVVDAQGNVHGIEGLSIIDASIMPTIPTANTNLPTFMLAERCSEWLVELD